MDLEKELEIEETELKRHVENVFSLRSKHPTRHIIQSRDMRCPFRVIENGQDVTPRPHIIPGMTYMNDEETMASCEDILKKCWEIFNKPEDTTVENDMDEEAIIDLLTFPGRVQRLDCWYPPDKLNEWNENMSLRTVPSMFRLRENPPSLPQQNQYHARLVETPTVFVLDLMSGLAVMGSDEANMFDEEKKKIRERERKKPFRLIENSDAKFTHIHKLLTRDESTLIVAPMRDDAQIDVNEFDRFKTFVDLNIIDPIPKEENKILSIAQKQHEPINTLRKMENFRIEMFGKNDKTSKEQEAWLESNEFMKSALFVERILAANLYSDLQSKYKKAMYSTKPVDDFKYIPQLLWTCSCARTFDKPVTCISWSIVIPDIFVVSYGQYLFDEKKKNGIVCVWNIKNTVYPERMCILENPVTYVELSKKYPRIAGIGFWDGTVGLLDIAVREPELLVKSDENVGLLHPIWQTKWFKYDSDELFVTCGQNGQMHTFEINRKFQNRKILTVQRVGNTAKKGIGMPQRPPNYDKYNLSPAIMFMTQNPKDEQIIFVGTDQGYVHVYSLFNPKETLHVFGAHVSQITAIEFNPVDSRIFLTSGNDFYVRIWGYNMYETYLLQLKHDYIFGVDFAAWCPAHPYMIVSLSGPKVDVWHLKRKYFEPVTTIENPFQHKNLVVSFNPTGDNFLIGDIKGYVHVYGFTSIPKPPEDPLNVLAKAILFPLSYDDERLRLMIMKLGPPFVPDEKKIKELFSTKENH